MRRLRTKNSPFISILSIGIERSGKNSPILLLSCGVLTSEIRSRVSEVEVIRVTKKAGNLEIDALDKNEKFLGSLVRHDFESAESIYSCLQRRYEVGKPIPIKLYSILKPAVYIPKEIGIAVVQPSRSKRRLAA